MENIESYSYNNYELMTSKYFLIEKLIISNLNEQANMKSFEEI